MILMPLWYTPGFTYKDNDRTLLAANHFADIVRKGTGRRRCSMGNSIFCVIRSIVRDVKMQTII
jgi:hypothetical protein